MDRAIVLFDGVCNVCNSTVQFVFPRDPLGHFLFAPLQSQTGQSLLQRFGLRIDDHDTVVVVQGDRVHLRSAALLHILRGLSGPWPVVAWLAWLVPRPMRDFLYGIFARNRYRWFGRRESCMVPTRDLRVRFLD